MTRCLSCDLLITSPILLIKALFVPRTSLIVSGSCSKGSSTCTPQWESRVLTATVAARKQRGQDSQSQPVSGYKTPCSSWEN